VLLLVAVEAAEAVEVQHRQHRMAVPHIILSTLVVLAVVGIGAIILLPAAVLEEAAGEALKYKLWEVSMLLEVSVRMAASEGPVVRMMVVAVAAEEEESVWQVSPRLQIAERYRRMEEQGVRPVVQPTGLVAVAVAELSKYTRQAELFPVQPRVFRVVAVPVAVHIPLRPVALEFLPFLPLFLRMR